MKRFINDHSEIHLEGNVIAIPEIARAEFYGIFDEIRIKFLEERFSGLIDKARLLAERHNRVQQEIVERLGLERVSLAHDIRTFLNNPRDRLKEEVFDCLFSLLRGHMSPEVFEKEAFVKVQSAYDTLYHLAYKQWVMLSLVVMLEADSNFTVPLPPMEMDAKGPVVPMEPRPLPQAQKSLYLSFEHEITPVFIVPEVIFHATALNRYVSFRSELGCLDGMAEVMWTASELSKGRTWRNVRSRGILGMLESAVLMYSNKTLEDALLIADSKRICRPDVFIECVFRKGQLDKTLNNIGLYKDALDPEYGIFIISGGSSIEQPESYDIFGSDICFLDVGLDALKLDPVVRALSMSRRT
jgi:hypothetical protein